MRFFWRRDLHALVGAYALDALDGAERDRFERHLRGCRACQSEVRGFAATATALAMATAAEPPPGLKQRVLAAPDAQIASARTSAGGIATVVASHSAGSMVFTSVGLQALPPSKVYELWFLGKTTRPAGLLPPPTRAGRTPPVLASGLAVGDKIGVTVEPAGGSSSPTTTPIVVLTLSA